MSQNGKEGKDKRTDKCKGLQTGEGWQADVVGVGRK